MQAIRGTRDILHDEIKYWRLIIEKAKIVLETANYLQICTPIIENTSLFTRSIGRDTDIINKEMYSFQDQGNRKVTLRPEGTASLVRALIEHKLYNNSINRLWYLGPMFRYERPQTGRQRQFYQLGIECLGTINPCADVEVIYLAVTLLKQLKCINFNLYINSIGSINNRIQYQEELKNYLLPYINELDEDSKIRLYTNPLRILDTKNMLIRELLLRAPILYDFLDTNSKQHFQSVCNHLNSLNIPYVIDNTLVRGLDYYNNTAFEIKTNSTSMQSTICGGGRYDNLVQQLGGPNIPAVGWAIGIERLQNLLKHRIQFAPNSIDIYIASQGENGNRYSLQLLKFLQIREFITILDFSNKPFKKQLKKASKALASVCLIVGEQEMLDKTVTVKWLNDGKQEIFSQKNLQSYAQYLKKKILSINQSFIA